MVVQDAVHAGITDITILTDIVFYLHHPDLIGTPIAAGQTTLRDEWKGWRQMVEKGLPGFAIPKKPAAMSEWEKIVEAGPWVKDPYLSKGAKDWLAEMPTHEREAGIFKSSKRDGDRYLNFLAWKTRDPGTHCQPHHGSRSTSWNLHTGYELKTSVEAIKKDHKLETDWISWLGNDVGAKGISLMHDGINILTFHYLMKKGTCLRRAKAKARKDVNREGKATIELISTVLRKSSGVKGASLNGQGFRKQIRDIARGTYPKTPNIDPRHRAIRFDETIYDGKREIGHVKYFD